MPKIKNSKRVKFYTLGCKVNQYESEALREQLLAASFSQSNGSAADLYVINTCTVTHRADSDARKLIRKAIKGNPKAQIVVTGCYVEKDASEIMAISDKIKILPNQQKHQIVDFLNSTVYHLPSTNNDSFLPLKISDFKGRERAFVKIQDGCDNFCSYCKVPLVRGKSRSRDLSEIKKEVRALADKGFKEIVLTGICLGDYHYQGNDLACVLDSLQNLEGEFRIRLSSVEPQLVTDELIEKIANSEKICPHLHIPLQSGDDAILESMKRKYSREDFLNLINKIKKKNKNVSITTDVLLGFPGEGNENFCNTVSCLKKISPLRTHIFSFSARRETAAFALGDRIDPKIIKERHQSLEQISQKCSHKFRQRFLRKDVTVLIEAETDQQSGIFCGYSENYIRIEVVGADKSDVNNLVKVKIQKIDKAHTYAELVDR